VCIIRKAEEEEEEEEELWKSLTSVVDNGT